MITISTLKLSKYFFFILCFLLVSCTGGNENLDANENESQLEDFETFNKRFHTDSLFQISRVNFPVEGKLIDGFEIKEWNKENWEFQETEVSEYNSIKQFEHEVSFSDTLVMEKYWVENSGFLIERKFKIINNSWFLVYYNVMNL